MLREMIHGKMLFLHPEEFWVYFSGLPGHTTKFSTGEVTSAKSAT